MSDFFDRLGAAAKRAAGTVSTGFNVAAEEQRIRECYIALGKLCYNAAKAGLDASGTEFDELYSRIDESMKRIRQLRQSAEVTGEPYAAAEDFEDLNS